VELSSLRRTQNITTHGFGRSRY